MNPPSGCRFHTRCPCAIDRCRIEMPEPAPWAADHLVACRRAAELPPADGIGVDRVAPAPAAAARRMALYARRREAVPTE
jgi:hypothetical protein